MSNASVAEPITRPVMTVEHPSERVPKATACITIIDPTASPKRALKGEPVTGSVSLLMLAGEEFGRIHELKRLRVHDGRLYGFSPESVPMGSIVTLGWQDPDRAACRGVVAFALPESGGWRITVELDSKLAA
jgi:hypothetical protein